MTRKELIKDFKMYSTGSYGYNVTREIKTSKDILQLEKEESEEYRKHKKK